MGKYSSLSVFVAVIVFTVITLTGNGFSNSFLCVAEGRGKRPVLALKFKCGIASTFAKFTPVQISHYTVVHSIVHSLSETMYNLNSWQTTKRVVRSCMQTPSDSMEAT